MPTPAQLSKSLKNQNTPSRRGSASEALLDPPSFDAEDIDSAAGMAENNQRGASKGGSRSVSPKGRPLRPIVLSGQPAGNADGEPKMADPVKNFRRRSVAEGEAPHPVRVRTPELRSPDNSTSFAGASKFPAHFGTTSPTLSVTDSSTA